MRTFWMAFFGRLAATAFVALCGLLGFGPDEWVRFVIPGPDTSISLIAARVVFLLLGAGVLGVALYQLITGWLPWLRPIPLPEAARMAYDQLDGTLWRTVTDKWNNTPDERLSFIATYLAQHVSLVASSPPSQKQMPIPPEEFKSGVFHDGGRVFRRHFEEHDHFVDLAISRSNLKAAIKRMKDATF
jgi:hypothetical protein